VWRADLDVPGEDVERFGQQLSADEHARAGRLRFERDRKRYITGRGILREILARYIGTEPAALCFSYGEHGKPELVGEGEYGLRFNVAHADAVFLCAVAESHEVGVDVERVEHFDGIDDVAEEMFSLAERAVYRSLPPDERVDAFAACWTRKEAFIKAIGEGLSYPLHQFDVSLAPGDTPALLRIGGSLDAAAHWCMAAMNPAADYVAAVVAAASVHRFRYLDFS
jgi:4'-phosphopantetheinyl transferase